MEILSYQDLINNAASSLNESQDLQETVTAYGLLQETIQLEYISSHNTQDALSKFGEDDLEVIEQLGYRLATMAKKARQKNAIKEGDRVARGYIAGIKTVDGEHFALIDGPGFHQWQRLEDIEL